MGEGVYVANIWHPEFVTRFATFAAAAARHIRSAQAGQQCFYAPVNEISFFRGTELKVQLARAAIAAMEAILAIDPAARFVHADPVINVVAAPDRSEDVPNAERHRRSQFESWDMIAGRAWPQIGGRPELLDIVGVNYYCHNQWIHHSRAPAADHPLAKPFHALLAETYARYGRPIFVAETGIEGDERGPWLRAILAEVEAAMALGVPVEGVCLYPILDHPGWDDERYCPNGLLTCSPLAEERRADPTLAEVIAAYQNAFEQPRRYER